MKKLIEKIFTLSDDIRYVAIYKDCKLFTQTASKLSGTSAAESDRYEELIVNPAVLLLTKQRGEIDCGGTEYVIIKYGNFFQFIFSMDWGHVSVCIEPHADPVTQGTKTIKFVKQYSFT